jgi:hypothetical protein
MPSMKRNFQVSFVFVSILKGVSYGKQVKQINTRILLMLWLDW